MKTKIDFINNESHKLKNIISQSLNSNKFEKALAAISVLSDLYYEWNQFYTDDFLEDSLSKISGSLDDNVYAGYIPDDNVVLFYDDFGLDTRGLALIYLKALAVSGYDVIYLTTAYGDGRQPEIDKLINESDNIQKIYFIKYKRGYYSTKIGQIQKIVNEYHPSRAFLYTTPWDSSGIVAFMQMKKVVRYQINLTDHAFWIGRNAFDYCVEFRNYGGNISIEQRKIPIDKIKILPYYPLIDYDLKFEGFPFGIEEKRIIFSGGSLYKTIGYDGLYYKMIAAILDRVPAAVFLYAGDGETGLLDELGNKYQGRVFHIHERKDLYQLIKNITIYINTYPITGGLMTQYAAIAGKIPLTLNNDSEFTGILLEQEKRQIVYHSAGELVEDAVRLLTNEDYRVSREKKLEGSVITREQFDRQVKKLIDEGKTDFKFQIKHYDTEKFRESYRERFDPVIFQNILLRSKNVCLYDEYKDYQWQYKKWFQH